MVALKRKQESQGGGGKRARDDQNTDEDLPHRREVGEMGMDTYFSCGNTEFIFGSLSALDHLTT